MLAVATPALEAIVSAVAVAVAGLGGGWFAARRLNSGKVATSDATTLWAEAEKLRMLYRDEATSLRLEVVELRKEAQALRDEVISVREEAAARRREAIDRQRDVAALEATVAERDRELALLRPPNVAQTTGDAPKETP